MALTNIINMTQLDLFPDHGVAEQNRLYVIGNGFDIHHEIESKYWDFKKWVLKTKKDSNLIGLMDTFFSNNREFWGDIENALGEYDEEAITDFCEPDNPKDFKYDHPGQWQDGVEGGIQWVFEQTMDLFRSAFEEWVKSIDISGIETDLYIPTVAKYLTFNYTETLEKNYGVPVQNVLHIHGNRLLPNDEFVLGHDNQRNKEAPLLNEEILLPYQNAYSSVIKIMNTWKKDPHYLIQKNKNFFQSLKTCKGVCVMGLSYNRIDLPYLHEIAAIVDPNCKWLLFYYSKEDQKRAEAFTKDSGLVNYVIKKFED